MINNKLLKIIAFASSIIVILIFILLLKTLKAVFIPLAFSIFISFLYAPLNRFLIKIRFHVTLRIFILLLILFAVTYFLVALGYAGMTRFINEFPSYLPSLEDLIVNIGEIFRIPEETAEDFVGNQLNLFNILNFISINRVMGFIANNIFIIFTHYVLIIFFSVFFLTDDKNFILKIIQFFFKDHDKAETVLQKIERQLNLYIINKTFINLIASILSAGAVAIIGVDFPILSGFLIFSFGYIPEIGSVIAALFPILFCFLKFGISWQLFMTILSLFIINSGMGNYLEPKLMGRQFNMSPILIIIVLILWGWIWGPIGMLLAVPITVILNIIYVELDKLRQISNIIRDSIRS